MLQMLVAKMPASTQRVPLAGVHSMAEITSQY